MVPWNPERGERISAKRYRVNREIRAEKVRLIDAEGRQVGIISLDEALQAAQEQELDLVEVAPHADPPVCRLMDFGKFLYERAKRERKARKAQKAAEVKEIRLRPKTGEHDLAFKIRQARDFLASGCKVKVRVRFRGREVTYPELGRNILARVAEELADVSRIEQRPKLEGRSMLMILAPGKSGSG